MPTCDDCAYSYNGGAPRTRLGAFRKPHHDADNHSHRQDEDGEATQAACGPHISVVVSHDSAVTRLRHVGESHATPAGPGGEDRPTNRHHPASRSPHRRRAVELLLATSDPGTETGKINS